jgi:hypothetical protein
MSVTAIKPRNAVESLREVVQDLLVPELKALKVEMSSTRAEMTMGFESIKTEMRLRDEKQSQATQVLSDKLAYAIDIRERLAVLEDRSARS